MILLRARLLSFAAEPFGPEDEAAISYLEDGALLLREGRIAAMGDFADLRHLTTEIIDHRPHLILPGFIDPHIHFPQIQVIASWGAQLLDWLNDYTFPEERRFADPAHARAMAGHFFDRLIDHGTTTACAFCTVHPASVDAYFGEAQRRNMRMLGGKVMMDRNAPKGLLDTAQQGHDESAALIARWHGRGRLSYVISPRFAITSSPAQLEAAGALAATHPDCLIQTHLSENHAEIALAGELYPQARDYLDIYQTYGLVGPRSLMGHAIHLTPREIAAMAEAGAKAVFCPTSNLFLGSGLLDEARLRAAGIARAVASDVGGGDSFSMLRTLNAAYKILQLRGQPLHPVRAMWLATRGNAEALGLADRIGALAPGMEADLVVLNARATPEMALRMARVETLSEELFVLQTLGDDRAVAQVYIAGAPLKPLQR